MRTQAVQGARVRGRALSPRPCLIPCPYRPPPDRWRNYCLMRRENPADHRPVDPHLGTQVEPGTVSFNSHGHRMVDHIKSRWSPMSMIIPNQTWNRPPYWRIVAQIAPQADSGLRARYVSLTVCSQSHQILPLYACVQCKNSYKRTPTRKIAHKPNLGSKFVYH